MVTAATQQAIEIEALRCFRRIVRAQSLAEFRGADRAKLVAIANIEIAEAKRDFDRHSTAAIPAQLLHKKIIEMMERSA